MPPDERASEFLPPEPSGPEPDIGAVPARQPGPPQQPGSHQPPPPDQHPHEQQQSQEMWRPQPWQPQEPWQHQAWSYQPQPPQPDNGAAVAGFVTSMCAAGLLLISFGFFGLISLIAAPFGIFYSRKGKRAVDEGRTPKHRGLAQAGFVIGIITFVLSLIATVVAIIFIVALATDEGFREDFQNNGGGFDSVRAGAALAAARSALALVG